MAGQRGCCKDRRFLFLSGKRLPRGLENRPQKPVPRHHSGSSIHEVYEDSTEEYRKANEILDAIEKNALKVLTRDAASTVTVVNNSSFLQVKAS